MFGLVGVELRKTKGSLAPWFVLAAPAAIGLLSLAAVMSANSLTSWSQLFGNLSYHLWGVFFLPMSIAVFTALAAQIEHASCGWRHMRVQPVPLGRIETAKAIVVLMAVLAMNMLLPIFVIVGGSFGGWMSGQALEGGVGALDLVCASLEMTGAALGLVAFHYLLARWFRSFVPPVLIGMAGTVGALAIQATGSSAGVWFPYFLPVSSLGEGIGPVAWSLAFGFTVILFALVVQRLAVRQAVFGRRVAAKATHKIA